MNRSEQGAWLIAALCSLVLVDGVILLDVPLCRPLFAFTYFSTVPGFLLLNTLKLDRLNASKRFVLSVGLSIAFLCFVGLGVNFLVPIVGITTPLSTSVLVGGYSAALFALMLLYRRNAVYLGFDFGTYLYRLRSIWGELVPFGIIAFTFPVLMLMAVRMINTAQVNIAMLIVLALVPAYVIFIWRSKPPVSTTTYVVATWMISLAMVLALPLRGIIAGGDFDAEFGAVQEMIHSGWWTFNLSSPVYSSLTSTFLTTVYHFLLGTSALETYQFVGPILLSILPVTIFLIAKRYVSSFSAFLCALLFVFQVTFLEAAVTSVRSRMGLLFLALILLVIFDAEIDGQKRQVLFLVFLSSMVVSYYTFSYLFVFLCLCTVILLATRWNRPRSKRLHPEHTLSLSILVLSAALVYLWWGIATQGSATGFITALHNSISSLTQIASLEARTATDQKIYATGLQGPAEVLNLIAYYATAALAVLGAVIATLRPKETKFEREYQSLMIGSLLLWVFVVAMPGLAYFVNTVNLLAFTLIILLPCIPFGAAVITRAPQLVSTVLTRSGLTTLRGHENSSLRALSRRKEQAQAVVVVLFILTFLANTGLSYQLFGQPRAVLLNSQGQQYDTWYVHPQEIAAGTWLSTHEDANIHIYADGYGSPRLSIAWELLPVTQQGSPHPLVFVVRNGQGATSGYSFLRYENVVDGTAILSGQTVTSVSQLYTPVANTSLLSGDRIYSNGGSDIYYTYRNT